MKKLLTAFAIILLVALPAMAQDRPGLNVRLPLGKDSDAIYNHDYGYVYEYRPSPGATFRYYQDERAWSYSFNNDQGQEVFTYREHGEAND